MVPNWRKKGRRSGPAPRTRGDGPRVENRIGVRRVCSPHPRGWSRHRHGVRVLTPLLPAPAGMVPKLRGPRRNVGTAPRTRGDGLPCPAPTCPRRPCSPHPRGWSPRPRSSGRDRRLLPAPAGMVPAWAGSFRWSGPAPRTRGDGPSEWTQEAADLLCSPHPQGWSQVHGRQHRGRVPAPRTRGDGPSAVPSAFTVQPCSPRPAGMGSGPAEEAMPLTPTPLGSRSLWRHPAGAYMAGRTPADGIAVVRMDRLAGRGRGSGCGPGFRLPPSAGGSPYCRRRGRVSRQHRPVVVEGEQLLPRSGPAVELFSPVRIAVVEGPASPPAGLGLTPAALLPTASARLANHFVRNGVDGWPRW
ncbi:hypothetical protein SAM23877_6484 [Streptomyces ambofaciens ATCC 23877]|uniref:Uncharacterized protein n=1 Tax=Streptomyces ambofaciens (strain ATCC 23877 / 3486 / DSM 40053 / JCM 4204 / NBRC 12836 / NRRL B-2516) TaxID=278992 RepID=A0A0K2B2P1_STRA7|nr:hypothetical protein SAM23877_6484 [Streptomyces ambofaciens ATCC 23877]